MRSKIMQHNSRGTVQYWQQTQFQILANLPKWYIQNILVKMVVDVHSVELENQWLKVVYNCDEDTSVYWLSEWKTIHSTLLLPLYSVYYHYSHSLLPTPINTPPLKHSIKEKENPPLGLYADHSGAEWQSYQYTNRLVGSTDYWYLWISYW